MNKHFVELADKVIEKMENEDLTFFNCYAKHLPLRSCGVNYTGINLISLIWLSSEVEGLLPYWFTFKQIVAVGGKLKKGSKGFRVYFFKDYFVDEDGKMVKEDDVDEDIHTKRFALRSYVVFNTKDIEGLDQKYYEFHVSNENEKIEMCETFFNSIDFSLVHNNYDTPYYLPKKDFISMPDIERFKSAESYYSVLCHELVHWTSHKKRCNRDFSELNLKGNDYAFEELVAEFGSVFLSSYLGIESKVDDNHVAYLQGWASLLKKDKSLLIKASSLAQKAVDFLISQSCFADQKLVA